jgi:DUF177 domain-containing protein
MGRAGSVSMQFDLRQLGRHGGAKDHLDRTFEASAFEAADDRDDAYRVVAPVHLVMDVYKDRDTYRVEGRVETELELECGRCLDPFRVPVDSTFELRYVPAAVNTGPGQGNPGRVDKDEREVSEDDLTTAFYKDEQLDLGELMHEQFVLALPMKPLCSERCKGLCPHCGTNQNTASCDCAPAWKDPRLAGLHALLPKKEN